MYGWSLMTKSMIINSLIFWSYFQLSFCGLKFLKRIGTPLINTDQRTSKFLTSSISSPCPNLFQYNYDEFGRLYGSLQINIPDADAIELEVDVYVGNRVNQGEEGSISLPYSEEQVINHILNRIPLNYKINFPSWQGHQPKITRIFMNGNVLCSGQPYPANSVSFVTMINLRHKLQINVTPLSSSNPGSGYIDGNSGANSNPFLDVRKNGYSVKPANPFNFSPKYPETSPELIYRPEVNSGGRPYSTNPFLNSIHTTDRPNSNGGSSTEKQNTTVSGIKQWDSTESPVWHPKKDPDPVIRDGISQYFGDICGRPVLTNSLVLNGKSVLRGAFPWLTALFVTTNIGLEYQCTATLISRRHVVTAGHCVKQDAYVIDPDKVVLILGRMNIQGWGANEGEAIMNADRIIVHPNYKSSSSDADISLIFMRAQVTFSKFIRPICIWMDDNDLNLVVGQMGMVVGWGRDESGRKVSPEPKQIELPIVSQEQCLRSNQAFAEITSEKTFCAGDRNGSGPCNGDSGGGFSLLKNGRWFLRGIVSMSLSDPYTRTCDLSNYVIFTDASKYKEWLMDYIGEQ